MDSRQVVAGIDGSPESMAAAHWAAREARGRDASLRLVHAWQWQPHPAAYVPADTSQRQWALDTLARAEDVVRAADPKLRIIGEQVAESAVTALLAAAEQAELVVLGSRGLGSVAGFLLGSVSQGVVARSPRPVVLVRACEEAEGVPDATESSKGLTGHRDVVLGLDVGHPCDELIEFAFDAARRRGVALHVVHAFSAPPGYVAQDTPARPAGPELLAERERMVIAALRPWYEKFPELRVTETVTEGRAAAELVHAATGAGLVVVGRRTRNSRIGIRTGPVAHAVLHHAGCPVAVVPHD